MKVLLMCAFLALTVAKPRQVTPQDQWVTEAPDPDGRSRKLASQWATKAANPDTYEPDVSIDDFFEYFNPEVTDDGLELSESDMLLTAEQRDGRQASTNLWSSPVSFAISSESAGERDAILAGIQHWRDNTCIQFEEVAEGSSVPHISFVRATGCWSFVGQTTSSGGQRLSIGPRCKGLGTVVHEVGHAMGLYHQQSRSDRDTYVTILFDNISEGKEGNFRKKTKSNNYSVPYDLTSVMHYGPRYFSKNGLNTIRVKYFLYEDLIGRRGGLSHRDKQIANSMYHCAADCNSPPTCQNGGFVGKDCTCVCPPNASGDNCETLAGDYYGDIDCGDLDVTEEGEITTPNYPENFPKNVVCWWVIKAPEGQRVKISITDMKLRRRSSSGVCKKDYLALRYSGDVNTNDQRACDDELQGQSFISADNQFIIKFKSGSSGKDRGFLVHVQFIA